MALEKAMLIRLDDDEQAPDAETVSGYRSAEGEGDDDNWLRVHFNPETLKTSLSTNLKSSDRGSGQTTAQYIEKSESTLTLELVFDTSTQAPDIHRTEGGGTDRLVHSDVRRITERIARLFLNTRDPTQADADKPPPPWRCHFRWGSFGFTGTVANMTETLDYFSADGVPLRASVALTLKQDRFQFQTFDIADAQNSVGSALQAAGQNQGGDGGTQQPSSQAVIADLNDPDDTASQRASQRPGSPAGGGADASPAADDGF